MPMMYLPFHQFQTLPTTFVNSAELAWSPASSCGEHPVVINRLEALTVNVGPVVNMGATGASALYIDLEWSETPAY
jgi:hypothetical protein